MRGATGGLRRLRRCAAELLLGRMLLLMICRLEMELEGFKLLIMLMCMRRAKGPSMERTPRAFGGHCISL